MRYTRRSLLALITAAPLFVACGTDGKGSSADGGPSGGAGTSATGGTGGSGGHTSGDGASGGVSSGGRAGSAGTGTGAATGSGAASGTGGVSSGGRTGGTGASTGAGGDSACPPECLVANECVTSCGQTPKSYGCCPCPAGTVNARTCSSPSGDSGTSAVSCDTRSVLCKRLQPMCPDGQVVSVVGACYGPCVPIDECTCHAQEECPNPDVYACHMSQGRCGPYVM